MTYLLALIAVVAVAVLCWKAFGPERMPGTGTYRESRRSKKNIIGPDDDPEFLWSINRPHHDGGDTGPER